MESASTLSHRLRTTWLWVARITATRTPIQTARTGALLTRPLSDPRYLTFRKFRGTTPAPVCCLRTTKGIPQPMAPVAFAAVFLADTFRARRLAEVKVSAKKTARLERQLSAGL